MVIAAVLCIALLACGEKTDPTETTARAGAGQTETPEVTADPEFTTEYIRGLFEPSEHEDFTIIDSIYADRTGLYLRKDVYQAFLKLHEAAAQEGIDLVIRSATRNFEYQKGIWERKWTGETKIENGKDASVAYPEAKDRALAILRYSSMPGTSRHHWGTDVDFNAFENSWFEEGEGLALYEFMLRRAAEFGFCQPYTAKGEDRPNGYEEEKWHWSYTPVSSVLTELASTSLKDNMISGFAGAEAAPSIRVVENYVLGINPDCK